MPKSFPDYFDISDQMIVVDDVRIAEGEVNFQNKYLNNKPLAPLTISDNGKYNQEKNEIDWDNITKN